MQNSIQKINIQLPNGIELFIKRDDLLHPIISGNKFRKLKYNLQEAKQLGCSKLLTFGGAFSNHIVAVAGAGNEFGFETIGIIRGEELATKIDENPSLQLAQISIDFLEVIKFFRKAWYAGLFQTSLKGMSFRLPN
mgnify:CR=1 FL=1